MNTDIMLIIAILVLIILCYGDPDILDGLIKMVNK
jgi:hypothetical protein